MTTTRPRHAKTPQQILEKGLPERRYLPELHGVRGLALAGVVIFHLFGSGRVSGGIDIFLAVSGFLFTGMLLRESATSNGRVNPLKYYGRLVRRILIPAAIVIAATLAVGLLISPVTQHRQLWAEARASLLYFENFELINSQLAYGAAGPETSPFQHFWSLSVQGQFYIVWPVMAILAVIVAKWLNTSAARVMSLIVGLVFIISFTYAIYVGSYNQDEAYLLTSTRAWELAFGGLLALVGGSLRLPKALRLPAGWLGFTMIVTCGFFLDGAQLFPGPWALWPLLGLTLILVSAGSTGGHDDPVWSATRFLSNKPLAWIGDHAYGLYLWHWPLLIYYLQIRERDAVGWRGALAILAVTVLLAVIMYKYVERPLQRVMTQKARPQLRALNKISVAAGACILIILGLTATALAPQPANLDVSAQGLDPIVYPGASQSFRTNELPAAQPFPALENIDQYHADYTKRGCDQRYGEGPGRDEILVCEDENAPEAPNATVVLAGGSHAGHLEGAFKNLGQKYGWNVLVVTKSRCDFGIEKVYPDYMCDKWSQNFIHWLKQNEVDLVITPGTRLDKPEYILDYAPMWWQKISQTGTDLMLVRGMPRGENIPECLAEGGTSQECGFSKQIFAKRNPLLSVDLPPNVHQVDVSRSVCPQLEDPTTKKCDAIIGNIIVSYDDNHLTSVFSQSLAPAFEAEMQETVPHLLR